MHTKNELKLKAILYIKDIIKKGEIRLYRNTEHKRKDDIKGFYYLNTNIFIDGEPHKVETIIAVDTKGNLLYDIFIDSTHEERQKIKRVWQSGR